MDLSMNDVDNILSSLGISSSSNTESTPTEAPQETVEATMVVTEETFSDEDLNDILQDNGFDAMSSEEESTEETILPLEDRTLEEEDNTEEQSERIAAEEESSTNTSDSSEADSNSLPLNSPTLLIDESTTRFSGAEWFKEIQKARIIIGGVGGIGSNLAYQLARMVPSSITLYDDDMVEMVNMAGQLFSFNDLGKSKVDAMAEMITAYTSMRQVNAIKEKFTPSTEPGDIMLCGFDNMRARKIFFNSWKKYLEGKTKEERAKCLYMDGKLSMDTLQILCIQGDDLYNINRYEEHFLFSDAEAEATVCSRKQTTYLACLIGSLMVNLFTNFIANQLDPVIPYDLPFFTEYTAPNMLFKTEC